MRLRAFRRILKRLKAFCAKKGLGGSPILKLLLILTLAAVLGAGFYFRQELSQFVSAGGTTGGAGVVRSMSGLGSSISKGFQHGFGAFQ